MSKPYVKLDKNEAAVLLVDHQAGLLSLVRDFQPDQFKNNVLALADLAAYFKLPTILTTSFEDGPNGPLVQELKDKFPKAPYIARPGNINAWDNEDFVKAVKATGKKQLIIAGVVLIGVLAEFMSAFLSESLEGTSAPPALMAVVVATISASPEILTALRSALRNRMQAVVNIAMGASLSTVILTVPVMEGIALYTGQPFIMAMTPVQTVMVFITLIAAAINLNDGETNAIEGMTHFILFATFIMLLFLGL